MRKTTAPAYSMPGHTDTVTSLQISPNSQSILSYSHDDTVRTWDIRPFAPSDRSIKTYDGAPSGLERNLIRASWDPKGEKIAAGSGDRTVVVWDVRSGKMLYKLPGHKGTVNDVRFSPADEPIRKWSHSQILGGVLTVISFICFLRQDFNAWRTRTMISSGECKTNKLVYLDLQSDISSKGFVIDHYEASIVLMGSQFRSMGGASRYR